MRPLPWALSPTPPALCHAKATQLAGWSWALTQPWAVASVRLLATQWGLSLPGSGSERQALLRPPCSWSASLVSPSPLTHTLALGLGTCPSSGWGRWACGPGSLPPWDDFLKGPKVGLDDGMVVDWVSGPSGHCCSHGLEVTLQQAGVSIIEASPWTGPRTPGLDWRPIVRGQPGLPVLSAKGL